jgi:hypothetical protein
MTGTPPPLAEINLDRDEPETALPGFDSSYSSFKIDFQPAVVGSMECYLI